MSNEKSISDVEVAENKHIRLDRAIASMYSVLEHANNLMNKIADTGNPDQTGEDRAVPSLLDVLEGGPDRLSSLENDLHKTLDQISEQLF